MNVGDIVRVTATDDQLRGYDCNDNIEHGRLYRIGVVQELDSIYGLGLPTDEVGTMMDCGYVKPEWVTDTIFPQMAPPEGLVVTDDLFTLGEGPIKYEFGEDWLGTATGTIHHTVTHYGYRKPTASLDEDEDYV